MSNEQQHDDGKFLTLVFHIESEGQRKALIHGAAWCAASDAHAIYERDKLRAANKELLAESDKLRTELGDLQIQALRLGGERNKLQDERDKLQDERDKLQDERDKLLAERQERTQTMHIGIKFNDAEFVRSMQTLIAEHTSEDAAELKAARWVVGRMNAELGRLSGQRDELVRGKSVLQWENAVLKAKLAEQQVARHQPTKLTQATLNAIVESMPNGLRGFLHDWHLTKFAEAVWAAAQKGGAA